MGNVNELIKALKCSIEVPKKGHSCEGCKYRGLEEVTKDIPIPTDVVINGKQYWEYCDTEKMAEESIEILESLVSKEDDGK